MSSVAETTTEILATGTLSKFFHWKRDMESKSENWGESYCYYDFQSCREGEGMWI